MRSPHRPPDRELAGGASEGLAAWLPTTARAQEAKVRAQEAKVSETAEHDAPKVGAALRRARHRRALDTESAARQSGLEPSVVLMLEEGDPGDWGADTHMLAALRIHARMLGLDPEPLVTTAWRRSRQRTRPRAATPVQPLMPPDTVLRAQRRRRRLLALAVVVPLLVAGSAFLLARGIADAPGATESAGGGEQPSDAGETAAESGQPEDPETTAETNAEADDTAEADPGQADPDEAGTAGPDVDGLPGRPPAQTPVQVLNALGDAQATAEVVDILESLGYEVVLVDTTQQLWDETATYYEPGWEQEAEALQARDSRFSVGGANDVFVDEAGLHVVVGLDWDD